MDGARRTWELLDDLEQQAEGLAAVARDADVAALQRVEYAEVDLAGRLHGSLGRQVRLSVPGAGELRGTLRRTGDGWVLLEAEHGLGQGAETVVVLAAVTGFAGLAARATPVASRPVTSRLSLASVLRRLADQPAPVVVTCTDGRSLRGRLVRVGADFAELTAEPHPVVVPLRALVCLRTAG